MTENLVSLTIARPADQSGAVAAFLSTAEAITVRTPDQYQSASETLRSIKTRWTEIEAERKKLKEPIDAAAKAVQDLFRGPLETLSSAEKTVKGKLSVFVQEQERIAREAQAKRDEAARKQREALEARAAKAEAAGKAEKAEALQQQAQSVVAPIVSTAPPAAAGTSGTKVWKFRIVNPALVPDQYKIIDESKVRGVVRALKGDTQIPGVEVYEEVQISSRAW